MTISNEAKNRAKKHITAIKQICEEEGCDAQDLVGELLGGEVDADESDELDIPGGDELESEDPEEAPEPKAGGDKSQAKAIMIAMLKKKRGVE